MHTRTTASIKKNPDKATVLVLGGTRRARNLLDWLNRRLGNDQLQKQLTFIYSLAGATRTPVFPRSSFQLHTGGFGGMSGLRATINDNSVTTIIEALHPFAHQMRIRAREAAWCEDIPVFHLRQKIWIPSRRDVWIIAETDQGILDILHRYRFRNPLVTLGGRLGLDWLQQLDTGPTQHALCRGVEWDPHLSQKFQCISFLSLRPPFSIANEIDLMKQSNCDVLVAKNSGQPAAIHKILAARHLGLPVILRTPPDTGFGHTYHDIRIKLEEMLS